MTKQLWKICVIVFGLTACASSPNTRVNVELPWRNLEEIKSDLNKIEIGKTTFKELKTLGFDPYRIPNTLSIRNSKIKRALLPDDSPDSFDKLAEGAKKCYKNSSSCEGYLFMIRAQDSRKISSTEIEVGVWELDMEVYLMPQKDTKEKVVIYIRQSLKNNSLQKTIYPTGYYFWSQFSPTRPRIKKSTD